MDNQSSELRQELSNLMTKFQEAVFVGFSGLRSGIETQVKDFGERLDKGVLSIDQRTDGIASKLNNDMEKTRAEAVANRDALRTQIEHKLDQNLSGNAEAAKTLRDELSGNFQRL